MDKSLKFDSRNLFLLNPFFLIESELANCEEQKIEGPFNTFLSIPFLLEVSGNINSSTSAGSYQPMSRSDLCRGGEGRRKVGPSHSQKSATQYRRMSNSIPT